MEDQVSQSAGSSARTHDLPVVGLHITRSTSSDAVAGAILRARRAGHDVLILASAPDGHEAIDFADNLGAKIIEYNINSAATEDPEDVVLSAARREGYPGVLWQANPETKVNFEASRRALEANSRYSQSIEPQPTVESSPHVLVAIPAYNEADTIGQVVTEALTHADAVVVVDDGSTDETAQFAEDAGATVITHDRNQGYGATLRTAFKTADRSGADHLVLLDGDGQHDPADIPRLIETQRETNAEIVIGSRFKSGSETDLPLYRRVGLSIVNGLTHLSFGNIPGRGDVKDTQSGLRTYTQTAIESLADDPTIGETMEASTDILRHADREGYDIEEVGATVRYDLDNTSRHNPLRHGIQLVMNLVRIIETERPISILGIPGFITTCLGLGFAYWTVYNFLQTGSFPPGLAIASVFFTLAGVFAGFTAIILHSLETHFDSRS